MNEKLPAGTEGLHALRTLERHLGRNADATIPMECGGINSTMPLVVAAQGRIPVIDADGMGRAFPELQMETFGVYGVSGYPLAIANEHGDATIVLAHDNRQMEWLARGITIRMVGPRAASRSRAPCGSVSSSVRRSGARVNGTATRCRRSPKRSWWFERRSGSGSPGRWRPRQR